MISSYFKRALDVYKQDDFEQRFLSLQANATAQLTDSILRFNTIVDDAAIRMQTIDLASIKLFSSTSITTVAIWLLSSAIVIASAAINTKAGAIMMLALGTVILFRQGAHTDLST